MEVHDQELQPSPKQDYNNVRPKEKQHNNVPLDLKINIPSYEEEQDGFKTPTSMEHKIQATLPPPPRKPKAKQLHQSKKRKGGFNPQVILDLSQEIEYLFSTSPLDLDLGPSNGKSHKKVKRF